MAKWDWLEKPAAAPTWMFWVRVLAKAGILFIAFNLLFAALTPLETLGRLSLYNRAVPGRDRLPYGENSASYSLSLNNVPAMFASHTVSGGKSANEYRVLLIGDSGTWGWLLENEGTLSAQLNALDGETADGRRITVYNLAYPIMSLTKDLLLLDYAMRYEPDMIVWLVTLQSFDRSQQLDPPLVQNNPGRIRDLIAAYDLNLDAEYPDFVDPSFIERTIVGQRRELADLLRYQVYGFSWAATGIDQVIDEYNLRSSDFDEDLSWQDYEEPIPLTSDELAFDVLAAGIQRTGAAPILLINEPIFISAGENSDLRYNFWYPRWAYDDYRALLTSQAGANDWTLLDLWDALPGEAFTDSPVHYTPDGARQLAERLLPAIQVLAGETG